MKRLRTVGRWLLDWRNGATVIAAVFVALLAFIVIDASRARDHALSAQREALAARADTASSARRRIDLLQEHIAELEARGEGNSAEIGQLKAEVAALQAQVEQQGARPVVPRTTTTSTTSTTAPRSRSTTTTTTRPRSTTTTTSTTRPCDVSVRAAGICIGGSQ